MTTTLAQHCDGGGISFAREIEQVWMFRDLNVLVPELRGGNENEQVGLKKTLALLKYALKSVDYGGGPACITGTLGHTSSPIVS